VARTDPFTQVTEMVGSGPYKFNAKERVAGSPLVYERFADYVPRADGTADWTAGPKVAHFDRAEWHVIPDASTDPAARQSLARDLQLQALIDVPYVPLGQVSGATA
jgi:peptide/nickel transport system substrate-binding protein